MFFGKTPRAAALMLAACALGGAGAADGPAEKENYPYAGHTFNVSSGEFGGEAICSVELDDMHPREYQITVETVAAPSFAGFKETVAGMKKRCSGLAFADGAGNVSSEPKENPDGVYRFRAKCFRGKGAIAGLYNSPAKYYRYALVYDLDEKAVARLDEQGIGAHMDAVLRRTCPFYREVPAKR